MSRASRSTPPACSTGDTEPAEAKQSLSLVEWAQQMARAQGDVTEDLLLSEIAGRWHARHGQAEAALGIYRQAIEVGRAADPRAPAVFRMQVSMAELLSAVRETRQEAYDLLAPIAAQIEAQMREVLIDRRRGVVIDQWIRLYGVLIRLLLDHGSALRLGGDFAVAHRDRFRSSRIRPRRVALRAALRTRRCQCHSSFRPSYAKKKSGFSSSSVNTRQIGSVTRSFANSCVSSASARSPRGLQVCWQKMEPYAPAYIKLRQAVSAQTEDT